jgi:glycosyltransferase involved in cell wall biosynthesis
VSTCWAMCLAYNERVLLPYWVRHYRAFCERVVVYVDDASDDGTASVAAEHGAEVRFHKTGGLDDVAFVRFAQERYKEARGRADWVAWVDADEFLYHPRLKERLSVLREQGVTLPQVQGYQMVGEAPPRGPLPITAQIKKGLPAREYSKVCVFDPELEVAWEVGKHTASVAGAVVGGGDDPFKLLHYRYLGHDWLTARNARNYARMPEGNRANKHGVETYPGYEGMYGPAWYEAMAAQAVEVVGA